MRCCAVQLRYMRELVRWYTVTTGDLLRVTPRLRTGGMGRNEVRAEVSYVVVYTM